MEKILAITIEGGAVCSRDQVTIIAFTRYEYKPKRDKRV